MKVSVRGCWVGGVLSLLILLTVLVSSAAAFYVSCDYYAYATASDGIPIMGDVLLTDQTYVDGDYTKSGEIGNYGSAAFYADMYSATVSAQTYAHGVKIDSSHIEVGTGRVEDISFEDYLTYTVPAGYYADGVEVSIGGSANGIISSDVGAGCKVQCYVSLGDQTFDTGLLGVGIDEEGTIQVNEDFLLTEQLVLPGSTLSNPWNVTLRLIVAIYNGRTWSVRYNTGSGYVTGDGYLDFTDGLKITQFQVPSGVTWTSESGAFPNLPTGVQDGNLPTHASCLLQNHPNPFNPHTTISFDLPIRSAVCLQVYDVSGRLVRTLLNDEMVQQGRNEVVWNGRNASGRQVASGVYFYRLDAAGQVETKRMVLAK